jgi:hypothetical protein
VLLKMPKTAPRTSRRLATTTTRPPPTGCGPWASQIPTFPNSFALYSSSEESPQQAQSCVQSEKVQYRELIKRRRVRYLADLHGRSGCKQH